MSDVSKMSTHVVKMRKTDSNASLRGIVVEEADQPSRGMTELPVATALKEKALHR
jgi:hypothetical protein